MQEESPLLKLAINTRHTQQQCNHEFVEFQLLYYSNSGFTTEAVCFVKVNSYKLFPAT